MKLVETDNVENMKTETQTSLKNNLPAQELLHRLKQKCA